MDSEAKVAADPEKRTVSIGSFDPRGVCVAVLEDAPDPPPIGSVTAGALHAAAAAFFDPELQGMPAVFVAP